MGNGGSYSYHFNPLRLSLWAFGLAAGYLVAAAFLIASAGWPLAGITLAALCLWLTVHAAMIPFHRATFDGSALTLRLSSPRSPLLRRIQLPVEDIRATQQSSTRHMLYGIIPISITHDYRIHYVAFDPRLRRNAIFSVGLGDTLWNVSELFGQVHAASFPYIWRRRVEEIEQNDRTIFGPVEMSADQVFWSGNSVPLDLRTSIRVEQGRLIISRDDSHKAIRKSWSLADLTDAGVLMGLADALIENSSKAPEPRP